MSEATLQAKLIAARAAMVEPAKNGKNPAFAKGGTPGKFVPLDEVLNAINPALLDHGLMLSQGLRDGNLITRVLDDAGSLELCEYKVADISDPQKYMAALTYAKRGSLMAAFGFAGDEDDDGNTASAAHKAQAEAKEKAAAEAEKLAAEKQRLFDALMADTKQYAEYRGITGKAAGAELKDACGDPRKLDAAGLQTAIDWVAEQMKPHEAERDIEWEAAQ